MGIHIVDEQLVQQIERIARREQRQGADVTAHSNRNLPVQSARLACSPRRAWGTPPRWPGFVPSTGSPG
jgi:hypothetical protein